MGLTLRRKTCSVVNFSPFFQEMTQWNLIKGSLPFDQSACPSSIALCLLPIKTSVKPSLADDTDISALNLLAWNGWDWGFYSVLLSLLLWLAMALVLIIMEVLHLYPHQRTSACKDKFRMAAFFFIWFILQLSKSFMAITFFLLSFWEMEVVANPSISVA